MDNLSEVKNIILVLSGKGGVGKSTVTTQLALSLRQLGKRVGVLDIDLCGPSIPKMFGVSGKDIHQCPQGWVPVYTDADQQMGVMSIEFLLEKQDDAVVWRGPKKNAMIKQFVTDVYWGNLDFLIIDTPPGTSDEHITIVENLKNFQNKGAVLVTTPQAVAVNDVRRELTFCRKTAIPVTGIIENMSGFVCPHCSECTNVFSRGGGEALADHFHVPFLGCIPLDPLLSQNLHTQQDYKEAYLDSSTKEAVSQIVNKIVQSLEVSR